LLDRRAARERLAHYRAGIVAAAIYNANPFRDSKAKAVSPLDFLAPAERRAFERPQTIDEQIEVLTAVMGCGPGKPNG
jgi:hypothetical protein